MLRQQLRTVISVREGILLGGRKKFALKITVCPKNKHPENNFLV